MKEKILEYLKKYGENYFISHIKRDMELMNFIHRITEDLNFVNLKEKIGFLIHDQPNILCENGKRKKYLGVKLGFGFCGRAKICHCLKLHLSNQITELSNTRTLEQKNTIRENWKKTIRNRYGVDHPSQNHNIKQKKIKTNLQKRGTPTPFQSEEVKNKIKQTNLNRYGFENPIKNEKIKQKAKKTNLTLYGKEEFLSSEYARQKINQTNMEKYGDQVVLRNKEIRKKINQTIRYRYGVDNISQKQIEKKYLDTLLDGDLFKQTVKGLTFREIKRVLPVDRTTIESYANKYQCRDLILWDRSSLLEDKIRNICDQNSIDFVQNTQRIISPMELDFYFPQSNSAIECHGLFWHSEIGGNKDKNYHYKKWLMCKEKGIDLYQLFEDEIENSFDVIKSKILYLNNKHPGEIIGARHLTVDWLTNGGDEEIFYKTNHLQGIRYDRTHAIGAWHNVFNLVAVMSVKLVKPNQIEIVRFATDINNRYPGVFSKMLNWYIKQTNFKGEVVSWSDNRHSNGHLYKSNGFDFVREQKPGYFVTDYEKRWRREHFMKNKIKERHPEVDLTKTEWQLEQQLGLDRIWDAGKMLWLKILF